MDEQNKLNENETKKVITEKIPEKFLADMTKNAGDKQKLSYQLLQMTINILNAQEEQKNILVKMKASDEGYKKQVQYAFDKMRLAKNKDYQWRYDGKDSFIGTLVEKRPEVKK